MFAVLFEVQPRPERWDDYLAQARVLRPELEAMPGFVDNVRYRSLTREGWLLSLSTWRDEKALVRWRVRGVHHLAQEKGRDGIFRDYHLRVGEVTGDSAPPAGEVLRQQRLDETEVGDGTAVVLLDCRRPPGWPRDAGPEALAGCLGLAPRAPGLVAWDLFDAILSPGDTILLLTWRDPAAAAAFLQALPPAEGRRQRQVRVVRDYGLFDRREAPQYYPPVGQPVSDQAGPSEA